MAEPIKIRCESCDTEKLAIRFQCVGKNGEMYTSRHCKMCRTRYMMEQKDNGSLPRKIRELHQLMQKEDSREAVKFLKSECTELFSYIDDLQTQNKLLSDQLEKSSETVHVLFEFLNAL